MDGTLLMEKRDTSEQIAKLNREVVLIVDDNEMVRNTIATFLQVSGLRVCKAANGKEAVRIFAEKHEEIAVILLDVLMPDMDGPDTLAKLREIDPDVNCCFVTGGTGPYSLQDLMDHDVLRVFEKPIGDWDGLADFLRDLIDNM